MSISLRDQMLGLGFKDAPKPPRQKSDSKPDPKRDPKRESRKHDLPKRTGKPGGAVTQPSQRRPVHTPNKPRTREDIDLAKAYAIRAQKEKDERLQAEQAKQEEARLKREAKAKLEAFLKDKTLNTAEAEHVRHFEYGGKIKRVHVTTEQLKALNAGALGVVQMNGRYVLVDAATLAEAEVIFAQAIALKIDPNAPVTADPYSDSQYQVPDDLVW